MRLRPSTRSLFAFALASAGAVGCSAVVARLDLVRSPAKTLTLLAVSVALWAIGAKAAVELSKWVALVAIGLVAVAIRLAAIGHAPPLSDDLHRYAWDAKVQASGTDPYRHPADSPALRLLRDSWFWPGDSTCEALRRPAGCTIINRPAERTIYPPVAQVWFLAVRTAAGGAIGATPWQAAGALVDLGLCVLLAAGLSSAGRDPRLVAWWALSPVAVVEAVANAHIDGLAALLCVAAVLASRRRSALAGGLVGAAAMVKLYPAVLLVAVARRRPVRALVAFAAVCVAAETPHIIAVGPKILGYLPGYLREEKYGTGSRFLLISVTHLPGLAVAALAATAFVGALGALWWADLPPERAAPLAIAIVIVVAAPVQPWYAVTAAALGVLVVRPRLSTLTVAIWPYFFLVILGDSHASLVGTIGYAVSLVVVVSTAVSDYGQSSRRRGVTIDACQPTTTPVTEPSPLVTRVSTVGSALRY